MNDSLEVKATSVIAEAEPNADITFPAGFTKDDRGLFFDKGDGKSLQLAGPFDVLGQARDPKGHGWGIFLVWNDRDGKRHQGPVPLADLIGEGVDVFRPLVSRGLQVASTTKEIKLLKEALFKVTCSTRVRLVKQTGWHNGSFVLPAHTLGDTAGERVLFDGNSEAVRYASAGNLEDWKEKVARPGAGNSRPVLACSAAFAGPLNDLLQGEGGGFHFFGPSSVGKSTMLLAAGSIWGGGGRTGFSHTWRGTENGLESLARAHSGTTLVLDEMGEADGKTIGSTTYMLMNGAGKARNTRAAELRVQPTWRIMLISSGELGLADKIRESGLNPRIGQLVRLVDVPADAGRGLGAFEDTKGMEPAAFAEALKADALRTFGTAGPAFVEYLAANRAKVEVEARALIKAIRAKLLVGVPPSDGQANRVAERFALAAAAGELARRALDLPWREGEAEDAATICFKAWREALGGDGPGELREALEALRTATERDGESRFRSLDVFVTGDAANGAPYQPGPIRGQLGFRFVEERELVWGFTATGWKEVLRGIGRPQAIAALLADKGMLVTKSDPSHRFAKRIDGRTVYLYALKSSALEEGV